MTEKDIDDFRERTMRYPNLPPLKRKEQLALICQLERLAGERRALRLYFYDSVFPPQYFTSVDYD